MITAITQSTLSSHTRGARAHFVKKSVAAVLLCLGSIAQAEAATIVGGSTLLDAAYANQLEAWLGEGPITLTNLYTKAPGDTAAAFHGAVDGKGRTFSIMHATEDWGAGGSAIVGGYNPQSWRGFDSGNPDPYNMTASDAERTAFIFNLSTTTVYRQNLTGDDPNVLGAYQTYNDASVGPAFGGGGDLWVGDGTGSIDVGLSNLGYSYGGSAVTFGTSIIDGSSTFGGSRDAVIGALEIFAITPVPEPRAYAMLLVGLGLMGWVSSHRRRRGAEHSGVNVPKRRSTT